MGFQPKRAQGAREARHLDVELLRMASFGYGEMAQNGEAFVDGMHKPEAGDFFRGITRATLRRGSTRAGKGCAFFVENVHESPRDDEQSFTRANLQARRNKTRIENKSPRAIAQYARDGQRYESRVVLCFQRK